MAARMSALSFALALLGCTAKQSELCDSVAADELVARLAAADPHERARLIGVNAAADLPCEFPTLYVSDPYHGSGLTDEGEAAFGRACLAGPELDLLMHSDQLGDFYDVCGFARFGVVSRSEYQWQPRAHPFAWALHQSMLDNGLSANQARPITRAWLLSERAEAAPFKVLEDLRLPVIEGDRPFDRPPFPGLLVQISPSELVIEDESMVQLDGGVLDPDDLDSWFPALEWNAEKEMAIAQAMGEPWVGTLVIAADIDTPRATLAEVISVASRIGYSRFATLAELQPFVYTAEPLFGPVRRPDQP